MKKLSCHNAIIYAFDKENEPVLTIDSGDRVEVQTFDCFENQIDETNTFEGVDWGRINPATGPIYVNGAQVGDVLKVKIERIDVVDQGVLITGPKLGVMGDRLSTTVQKIVKVEGEQIIFDEKLRLPLQKMIGVIGVAPKGEAVLTGTPGAHGGNMDSRLITEGHTLYLPINVEGALLALGDFHASMGDGEVGASGVEIEGKATLAIDVLPESDLHFIIKQPVVETNDSIVFLASEKTLDEAAKVAAVYAIKYVSAVTELSLEDATMLMSAAGDAGICQIVDPLITAKFTVPKHILKAYGINTFLV